MFTKENPRRMTDQRIRQQYDGLYNVNWLKSRTSLLARVLRYIPARPQATLLDVACGDGQMAPLAEAHGLRYFGLDFSLSGVRLVGRKKGIVGDGMHLPFPDDTFDFVTNVGSLEHFIDPALGVQEMARVLKHDALACILLPNAFSLTWNVLRVWRTGDLAGDDGQPIQRFGTHGAWQHLLEQNGMVVEEVAGYERSWPKNRHDWLLYFEQPKELLLALLSPLLPLHARRCYIFVCRK